MTLINSFSFICFFNSFISFIIGFFVYLKNKANVINKIWAIFCLTVFFCSIGLGMIVKSGSYYEALFWLKYIHYFGLIFLPITFLHFCFVLLGIQNTKKQILIASYILGFLFLISTFLGYLVDIKTINPFNYYIKSGLLYPIFIIIFFSMFFYAFIEIFIEIKKSTGYRKKQLIYFLIGTIIGLSGGSSAFLPVFNIPIFPYGIYIFPFYIIIISYAIIRYHLMGINIKSKKNTIHTLIIIILTIIYILTIILVFEKILNYFIKYKTIVSQILICSIIALTFLPVYNKIKSLINQINIAYNRASINYKIKKLYSGTVNAFVKAIETKDKYTQGHSYRVVNIALKIGMEYGLCQDDIELLKYSSVLHDIGNIAIPDNILTKLNKLSKKEFNQIKKHPIYGKDIISTIEYFKDAGKIILHHHEQWDGKGYPDNIKKEQIPLLSRIIFIAEVFDALTSERSFRPPLSKEAALKEIQNESGKKFDPELVNCFALVCFNL